MIVKENAIESRLLGRPSLEVGEISPADDLEAAEKTWLAERNPAYVAARVAIEDVRTIHRLEAAGFRFLETQLRLTLSLRNPPPVPQTRYVFQLVESEESLSDVLSIVRETFTDDRWTIDPFFANRPDLAGKRYEAYVRQSFDRDDERVYRLYDPDEKRTVAVKTHRYLDNGEVLLLLGGVHPDSKGAGLGPLAALSEYRELVRNGVQRLTTHVSARNYAVVNLELGSLKHRLLQSFVVLRKTYAA